VQNRPQRALASLQRLATEVPEEDHPPQLAYLQGIAMQAMGRHEDAIAMFTIARQRHGDRPEILLKLAEAQWQVGRLHDARGSIELVAALRPDDPQARALLSEMAAQDHRHLAEANR
jgi:Flp pilus assembly protein TadD